MIKVQLYRRPLPAATVADTRHMGNTAAATQREQVSSQKVQYSNIFCFGR